MNVSIIIATHGAESWEQLALARPLPSAQSQEAEVLIAHDPDGNRATVRNALAAQATGDYLCFLDGDDELAPGFVRAMQRAWEQAGGDDGTPRLLTPAVSYVVKGRKRPPRFWKEIPLTQGNWMVCGTLVPRDFFFEVGCWREFDPSDWNEYDDYELWIRCIKAGAEIVKVPRAVYIAHMEMTSRHRVLARSHGPRWHYEIGKMHYPEHYPDGWMGQHG